MKRAIVALACALGCSESPRTAPDEASPSGVGTAQYRESEDGTIASWQAPSGCWSDLFIASHDIYRTAVVVHDGGPLYSVEVGTETWRRWVLAYEECAK